MGVNLTSMVANGPSMEHAGIVNSQAIWLGTASEATVLIQETTNLQRGEPSAGGFLKYGS